MSEQRSKQAMIFRCRNGMCSNQINPEQGLICPSCLWKKEVKKENINNNPFLREIRECYIRDET